MFLTQEEIKVLSGTKVKVDSWIQSGDMVIGNRPTLFIVRGIPGSGKSTFVQCNGRDEDRWFEADKWFAMQQAEFNPTNLKIAHQVCRDATLDAMTNKINRIWLSNTFTLLSEMIPYIKMAVENGYNISVVEFLNDPFKSVHDVPEETLARMRKRYVKDNEVYDTISSYGLVYFNTLFAEGNNDHIY